MLLSNFKREFYPFLLYFLCVCGRVLYMVCVCVWMSKFRISNWDSDNLQHFALAECVGVWEGEIVRSFVELGMCLSVCVYNALDLTVCGFWVCVCQSVCIVRLLVCACMHFTLFVCSFHAVFFFAVNNY